MGEADSNSEKSSEENVFFYSQIKEGGLQEFFCRIGESRQPIPTIIKQKLLSTTFGRQQSDNPTTNIII
jgi:hypothetical protein